MKKLTEITTEIRLFFGENCAENSEIRLQKGAVFGSVTDFYLFLKFREAAYSPLGGLAKSDIQKQTQNIMRNDTKRNFSGCTLCHRQKRCDKGLWRAVVQV